MYIWIGCKLPEAFGSKIRSACLPLADGLDISGFSLPQHISLKISFQAGSDYLHILDYLEALLQKEDKFYVNPKAIQRQGNILWIPFRENPQLRHLHNVLDKELKAKFGIGQHLFDKAFLFHSTLMLGPEEKLEKVAQKLWDFPLPQQLEVDAFLLGISETGRGGEYRVVREIKL